MPRNAFTLAAVVTAAVPDARVERVASLSTGTSGRFESALVRVADDTETAATGARVLVVRVSTDDRTAAELGTESIALAALTDGVREQLPFIAPRSHGETIIDGDRACVVDFIGGYAVAAADLPEGEGAAASAGRAIAAIHALPPSVVRTVGLPVRDADDVRTDVRDLVERAIASRRLPVALAARWSAAVDDDALWRFEPTVVLGEADADSFRFSDVDDVPTVSGVIGWHALAVGDPAIDLHWSMSAADAMESILSAYAEAAARTPDPHLHTRARLYAELEFARWLVHGVDQHQDDIVEDAAALLASLADGLGAAGPLIDEPEWNDEVVASPLAGDLEARLQASSGGATAMQTDTFDPADFADLDESVLTPDIASSPEPQPEPEPEPEPELSVGADPEATAPLEPLPSHTAVAPPVMPRAADEETAPIEPLPLAPALDSDTVDADPVDAQPSALWESDDELAEEELREAERASRAAFHRWASSDSDGTSSPRITRSSET